MSRYEVIPYRWRQHRSADRRLSIFSVVPEPSEDWEIKGAGFTVRDNQHGTIGFGKPPFATLAEAKAFADRLASL